jgi:hypothetical protein
MHILFLTLFALCHWYSSLYQKELGSSVQVCLQIFEVFIFVLCCSVKPFAQPGYAGKPATAVSSSDMSLQAPPPPPWEGRAIATHKLRLVEFSAFMEQQRDADTVCLECFLICLCIKSLKCLNSECIDT